MVDTHLILNLLPQPLLVIDKKLGIISYMNEAFTSKFTLVTKNTFYDLISIENHSKFKEIITSLNNENTFQELTKIWIPLVQLG